MSRLVLLLALSSHAACTERALDRGGNDVGFASFDLAVTTADAGMASAVGVPCSGSLCTGNSECCASAPTGPAICATPMGVMNTGFTCGSHVGYFCDGPEDCMNGLVCVAGLFLNMNDTFDDFGAGSTNCGSVGNDEHLPDGLHGIVCHDNGDCPNGQSCNPDSAPLFTGAPQLSICNLQR